MLTNERASALTNYLVSDKDNAKALLELTPEEAAVRINEKGYDFTPDEIREFGEQMVKASKVMAENSDELSEDMLTNVAGGVITELTAAACVAAVALGYTIGKDLANRIPW